MRPASDHFKARGLAPLRKDKDGSIILDPALALKPKTLRVRISHNGKITGMSHLPVDGAENDSSIEKTIQLARDSLFEEELFHEMRLETRQLLPYGVEYRDSVIHVKAADAKELNREKKLLIDCIARDDHSFNYQDHSGDWLAQDVAEGLRLLLAHEHSMRLYRRSQLPPPLTGQKREAPSPPLLRTLLAVFHHIEGVDALYEHLGQVTKTLSSAGLSVHLETTRESSWASFAKSLQSSQKKRMSATDQLLEMFAKPFEGKAILAISPSSGAQQDNLTIATRTVIGQPTFGTEHKLILPSALVADLGLFQQLKFTSVEETTSYLDWILSLHVAHRCLKGDFPRALIKENDARLIIRSKDAKKEATVDQDISVELQNGELKLTTKTISGASEDAVQSYVWKGQEGEVALVDKVKSWVG